jgi:hypothetical protein
LNERKELSPPYIQEVASEQATNTDTQDTFPNSVLTTAQAPPIRCAAYARYSSEAQKKTSSEDQLRNNRAAAEQKGWVVLDQFIRVDER